jgi:acyl carrier protein phosphodiesterase
VVNDYTLIEENKMNAPELKEMAQKFQKENPRFMGFSLDMLHYAVKAQTGYTLNAQDYTQFLTYLTGSVLPVEEVQKALDDAPAWLKAMYNRKD